MFSGGSAINRYDLVHDPVEDKIVAIWEGTGNVGKAIVGEIDAAGNSSSWAGETTYCSNRAFKPCPAFYPGPNKIVISFMHYSSSERGAIVAGTVSGNTVTFGSIQYYEQNYQDGSSLAYDSITEQMLIGWVCGSTGSYLPKVVTSTLSGTTFTFGTAKVINGLTGGTGNASVPKLCFDSNSKKALFVWQDATNSNQLSSTVLTVNGTFLTQSSTVALTSGATIAIMASDIGSNLVLDTDTYVMSLIYRDQASGEVGLKYVSERIGSSNMTAGNFVGLSQAAYTNGQTATIDVIGSTNTNQTGLTTATKYFVQGNGALGTTADDPSVSAGLALSDTSILIR